MAQLFQISIISILTGSLCNMQTTEISFIA